MTVFINILNISLISIFLQNSIFERALGLNILLYASRKKNYITGFSFVITYVLLMSSIAIWFINLKFADWFLEKGGIFIPLIYILVVGVIYILSLIGVWRFFPNLFKNIKTFVHISVFNCSVLGAMFISGEFGSSLGSYIGFGLGTGIGFFLAGYLLYIAHERLNSELVPEAFRGMPVMLVYVGILSLSMFAFVERTTA